MANALRIEVEGNVVVVHLDGKLTGEMYEAFVPAVETVIRECGRIRVLLDLHDFHGWTAGALWQDVRFDLKHFRDIERLAIVGESRWQKGMATFCKPFVKAEVRYFDRARIDEARVWIGEASSALPTGPGGEGDELDLAPLFSALGSEDGTRREQARSRLVEIGPSVVEPLLALSKSEDDRVRWEATKALASIADPSAARGLVERLDDESDIRWIAAEGLRKLRAPGLREVLRSLTSDAGSPSLRAGAHHVLKDLPDESLRPIAAPVVAALEDPAAAARTPAAASSALEKLEAGV
jgi:hypothetical protein